MWLLITHWAVLGMGYKDRPLGVDSWEQDLRPKRKLGLTLMISLGNSVGPHGPCPWCYLCG